MTCEMYLSTLQGILQRIRETQLVNIKKAAEAASESILAKRAVYIFGSGHSVIPCLDIFPRYGSFVGFCPILDPRLMWFNIIGAGGVRELLWLERQEGYVRTLLQSYRLDPRDTMIVFSHGGLNAAPVEMALEAKRQGLTVVGVTSGQNAEIQQSTHTSGRKLVELADIAIDNCVPPEDAMVNIGKFEFKIGAASTVAATAVAQAIVVQTAEQLEQKGVYPDIFVSPNVKGVPTDHNDRIFQRYSDWLQNL